jgi:hypothetical protein
VAKAPKKPGKTHEVARDALLSSFENRPSSWAEPEPRVAVALGAFDRREAIAGDLQNEASSASRVRLMQAAGLDPSAVSLRGNLITLFREAPVVDAPSGAVA